MTRRATSMDAEHFDRPGAPSAEEQLEGLGLFGAPEEPAPIVRRVPVVAHLRRVEGPPRPDGAEQRDDALEGHADREAVRTALVYVRARLLTLYRTRLVTDPNADVSADDVDDILVAWPDCPTELRTGSQNWRGKVFFGAQWQRTGRRITSKRGAMHAHDYPTWRPTL